MLKSNIKPVRTWQYFHMLGLTTEVFRLIIGFPEHLQKLATNKDYALTVLHNLQIYVAHNLLSLLCLHQYSDSGFQRRTFTVLSFQKCPLASASTILD
jgi:hypothetical protein